MVSRRSDDNLFQPVGQTTVLIISVVRREETHAQTVSIAKKVAYPFRPRGVRITQPFSKQRAIDHVIERFDDFLYKDTGSAVRMINVHLKPGFEDDGVRIDFSG